MCGFPGLLCGRESAVESRARRARLVRVLRLPSCGFLFALLLVNASCKPGVGSSCEKGEARCLGDRSALACQAGKFIETPCRGPHGCTLSERGTSCDISGDKPGEACSRDDEGTATCADHATMLVCHDGVYGLSPCRGPRGCELTGDRAACDSSIAELNDACRNEGTKACAADKSAVLICKDRVMTSYYPCRGVGGCSSSGGKLSCDTSLAKLGDPCDPKLDGQAFACTPDGSNLLLCKSGAFALDQTCKSGQKCLTEGSSSRCGKPGK